MNVKIKLHLILGLTGFISLSAFLMRNNPTFVRFSAFIIFRMLVVSTLKVTNDVYTLFDPSRNSFVQEFFVASPNESKPSTGVNGTTVSLLAGGATASVAYLPIPAPVKIAATGFIGLGAVLLYLGNKDKTSAEISRDVSNTNSIHPSSTTHDATQFEAPSSSTDSSNISFEQGGTSLREDVFVGCPNETSRSWLSVLFDYFPSLKESLLVRLPDISGGMDIGYFSELFGKVNYVAFTNHFYSSLVFGSAIGLAIFFFVASFNTIINRNQKYPVIITLYSYFMKVRTSLLILDLTILLVNSYIVMKNSQFITENYIPQDVGPVYDNYLENKKTP